MAESGFVESENALLKLWKIRNPDLPVPTAVLEFSSLSLRMRYLCTTTLSVANVLKHKRCVIRSSLPAYQLFHNAADLVVRMLGHWDSRDEPGISAAVVKLKEDTAHCRESAGSLALVNTQHTPWTHGAHQEDFVAAEPIRDDPILTEIQRRVNEQRHDYRPLGNRIPTSLWETDGLTKLFLHVSEASRIVFASTTTLGAEKHNTKLRSRCALASSKTDKFTRALHVYQHDDVEVIDEHLWTDTTPTKEEVDSVVSEALKDFEERGWSIANNMPENSSSDVRLYRFYKIFNKTNPERCYVGKTTRTLAIRMQKHAEPSSRCKARELIEEGDWGYVELESREMNQVEADRLEQDWIRRHPGAINVQNAIRQSFAGAGSATSTSSHVVLLFQLLERPEFHVSVAKPPNRLNNPISIFLQLPICKKLQTHKPELHVHWEYSIECEADPPDIDYWIWKFTRQLGPARICCNQIMPEKLTMFDFLEAQGYDRPGLDEFHWLYMWHSPSLLAEGKPCRKITEAKISIAKVKAKISFQARNAQQKPLGVLMSSPDLEFSVLAGRKGSCKTEMDEAKLAVRAGNHASEFIGYMMLSTRKRTRKAGRTENIEEGGRLSLED